MCWGRVGKAGLEVGVECVSRVEKRRVGGGGWGVSYVSVHRGKWGKWEMWGRWGRWEMWLI